MTAADLYAAGDLPGAIDAALAEVKAQPGEVAPRWRLAEFLCFAGDLERADKHLETVMTLKPEQAINASLFRNLLRGEMSRREIAASGRAPEFVTEPTPTAQSLLAARMALRGGDAAEAAKLCSEAEAQRPVRAGVIDEQPFDDIRDLDDLYSGVLEILSADGLCVWLPMEHIGTITFGKPTHARDLIWRQALIMTTTGQRIDTFVPALYVDSYKEASVPLKLGRATEWKELAPGLTQGLGQRMWLAGENVKSILEIESVRFKMAPK
jgi:type VI secretion system protein ImpE